MSVVVPDMSRICSSNGMIPIRRNIVSRSRDLDFVPHARTEDRQSTDVLSLADDSVSIFLNRTGTARNFEEAIETAADDLFVSVNTVVACNKCRRHWISIARAKMEDLIAAEFSEVDIFEEILDSASTAEFVVRIVKVDSAMLRNFEFSPTSVFNIFHLECK